MSKLHQRRGLRRGLPRSRRNWPILRRVLEKSGGAPYEDDVDLTGILGSVMAHEIGHLLLGSHAHAISGIVRGHWESGELHQIAMGTLRFLPWQEQRMRLRVAEWGARLVSNRDGLAQ